MFSLKSIGSAIKSLYKKVAGLAGSGGGQTASVIGATGGGNGGNTPPKTISGSNLNNAVSNLNTQVKNQGVGSTIVPQVYTSSVGGKTPNSGRDYTPNTGTYTNVPVTTIEGGDAPSRMNSFLGSPIYGTSAISSSSTNSFAPSGSSTLSSSAIGTNVLSNTSAPSVNFPTKPAYNNIGAIDNSGVAGILSEYGFTIDENGQFVQGGATGEDKEAGERLDLQKSLMDMIQEKESVQETTEFREAQRQLNQRRTELANYTAQLNSVVAKRDADLLNLREIGSREGVTETVYGGQEAVINREAAIKALPIQAQVAAAQGNVQLAQDYLTQVTSFMQEKINNEFAYRNALVDSISGFLTNEQKIKADKVKQENDRAWETQSANNEAQLELAMEFAKSGQTALINSVYGLNTTSPDFARQYAQLASSLKGAGGGSNQQTDNERALMSQFRGEQIVKDYNDILGQKGTIDAYIQNGVGGPADLALVFSFMRGLDPTSVVRESEYETAAKSGNIFQGAFSKFNGYFKEKGGFLPANVRQEFQNLVNQKLAVKQRQYDNVKSQYESIADRQGLDKQNVVIDYAGGAGDITSPVTDTSVAPEIAPSESFWGKAANWLWGSD